MLLFVLFLFAFAMKDDDYVITQEIIESINNDPTSTWEAAVNPVFAGKTWGDVKKMMRWLGHLEDFPNYEGSGSTKTIPEHFDVYKEWKNCSHAIRNQGDCGSCWAFSAAEAMTDRFCIKGKDVILSPQDLVSCDKEEYACQGGYLSTEWEYFEKTGVVSDKCFPYESGKGHVPKCPRKCKDSEEWKPYKAKKGSTKHYHTIKLAEEGLMAEGSIQGGFTVYQDFFSYKKGIYVHKKGGVAGGHAIKIQGWGEEKKEKYWIVANSWGASWGMDGYFWIKKGDDECGIEDQMYCATPEL